jgi:hypothetical protein
MCNEEIEGVRIGCLIRSEYSWMIMDCKQTHHQFCTFLEKVPKKKSAKGKARKAGL